MSILPSQRHLFDIPDDVAYLNLAYQGPLLNASVSAIADGAQCKAQPWTTAPKDFFSYPEKLRELLGRVCGVHADRFAIVPSASYGLATAAKVLGPKLEKGDQILMVAETFPSTYLTWKRVADETGAEIVMVDAPGDDDWTSAILNAMTPATRLLSLPQCHWANGAVINVEDVADAAHKQGAYLVFDLTQTLTAMPFDFARVKPDFVATAGYKWMLFPYGLGSLYVDPKWHDAAPLEETWMNREEAHVFEKLADYSHVYQPGARRFDLGEKSMPTLVYGGISALEQILDWGVENITETLSSYTMRIANVLEEVGLVPVTERFRSTNILGARSKTRLPEDLVPNLTAQNIFISRRGNSLRFSPYLHNSEEDFVRLEAGLKEALSRS
ncbi:MAG: aminotransferase [Ponticaulis sp.]|nr:aminotransferase [Ponticaulis sp.]